MFKNVYTCCGEILLIQAIGEKKPVESMQTFINLLKGFSNGDEMAIQQHKHCPICEKAIPADRKFCSDRCEEIYEGKRKKAKRTQLLYFGAFAIIFGWFLIMAFLGPG
jgi:predicted nucleic acid-binding Zn ribbon protein